MEIVIKKKEVCELLEKYYRENKNIEAKVTLSATREPVGLFEEMSCVARVKVTKKVNILGTLKTVKEELSRDEVLGIFRDLLESQGYLVTGLTYDAYINSNWVGYGMGETLEHHAYFNGLTLYVKENKLKVNKTLNR